MSQTVFEVLFFVALLVVILIHEGGHFVTAKLFHMKVEEFFLGFGPKLWSFKRGDTEYGVKAIPAGGYVKIAGMNPLQPPAAEDRGRTYADKPPWQRAIVVAAGPVTHFLIAILVLAGFFVLLGVPKYQPVIAGVDRTLNGHVSPAAQAGLRAGDVVVGVDGHRDISDQAFVDYTRAHIGQTITLTLRRGAADITATITPELSTVGGQRVGRLGVTVSAGEVLARDRVNPISGIARATGLTWSIATAVVARLGDVFGPSGVHRIAELLGGAPRRSTDPGSVVGVARLAGQAASAHDWGDLILLFASVNVFVGILNLVPLPPFDGGHIAIVAWEKLTRRRLDPRRLVPITVVVLGFVVLLSLSVLYLDIVNPLPNPFR
jgi:membrane-associated protease RseP (regulator of RpoE activity)